MKALDMSVSGRTETGKGPNRRLRVEGKLPAVLYGAGLEPVKLTLDYKEFDYNYQFKDAKNALIALKGDAVGADTYAVVRESQRDPLTRRFLHVDFFQVRMDQENDFVVPVHGIGNPKGVRDGGMLETITREITVRCKGAIMPTHIDVNIEGLLIGQSIHSKDIELAEGITLISDPEETLFTVIQLRTAANDSEETAEPEVVGKKKEDK